MSTDGIKKTRAGRRACWLLGLLGLGTAAVLAFMNCDLLWTRYCMLRLERAETQGEATICFRRAEQALLRWPRARESFIAELGVTRPKLTFWFCALLDVGIVNEPVLVQSFGKALEEREDLARCWSHFVRWRGGEELWQRLLCVACGLVDSRGSGNMSMPQSHFFEKTITQGLLGPGVITFREDPRSPDAANLRDYAVLWFLGASPLRHPAEARLTPADLLRLVVHNAQKDRCEEHPGAGEEQEPGFFVSMGKLAPRLPLPDWVGDVPSISDEWPEENSGHAINIWTTGVLRKPGASTRMLRWAPRPELYDGVWPPPGSDPVERRSNLDRILEDRGSEQPLQPIQLR